MLISLLMMNYDHSFNSRFDRIPVSLFLTNFTDYEVLIELFLQPFYGPLDFVWDYPGELPPER